MEVITNKNDIVKKCAGFLRGAKGYSLPIISTETAAKLGFRAILPLVDVILSSIQGSHNGAKTTTSTSMTITTTDVEKLDEIYNGCYIAMCMTEGQLSAQMNESVYWKWRAEQTELVYGESRGKLSERMVECVQEAEECLDAVLYTRDRNASVTPSEEAERQEVQRGGASGENVEQATQLYPTKQARAAVPTQLEEYRSTKEQADFHFDQQPKTMLESFVGGVVSAVKAIGRVAGHTPTRQQDNDEVVEELTHKDWTQTETERQYAKYSENRKQEPIEVPPSGDGAHWEQGMAQEEIRFQSESKTSSAAGSTKEEFAEMLRNIADDLSDEEQQGEEQIESTQSEGTGKRIKPRLVDAAERKDEKQTEIRPSGPKEEECVVEPFRPISPSGSSIDSSEALEKASKQGRSSEMDTSEASREHKKIQRAITKRR